MISGVSCMVCEVLGLGSTVQGPGFSSRIQCERVSGKRAYHGLLGQLSHRGALSPGWGSRKINVDL